LVVRGVGVDHDDIPMAGLVRQTVDDQQLLIMQGGVHGMPVHTDGPCGKGEHKRKHSNRQNDGIQPFQQVFVLFAALCYSGTCHSQSSPLAWHRN